jgi:hypothetical protein
MGTFLLAGIAKLITMPASEQLARAIQLDHTPSTSIRTVPVTTITISSSIFFNSLSSTVVSVTLEGLNLTVGIP